jgi:predicted GTPase
MDSDDERNRVERAVEGTRDWVERAGGDVVNRLSRAWDSVRDRKTSDSDASDGKQSEPVDDETLFSRDRQREFEELGHANILIIGQTGVGKSTLINAVFRKPLAAAGTGRPVTKVIQRFEDPDVPVTLYDTKGVELGDSKKSVIRDFKKEIDRSRKGPP